MSRTTLLMVLALTLASGCGKESEPKPEKPGPESGPPSMPSPDPMTPPRPARAYLVIESDPSGAQVEVGLKERNGVVTPGTGRMVGTTPCKVELKSSDVSSRGGITVLLKKSRYRDHIAGISDGMKKIAAGGEYKLSSRPIKLNRLQ